MSTDRRRMFIANACVPMIEEKPREGVELVMPHCPCLAPPGPVKVAVYAIAVAFAMGLGVVALWMPQP